MRKINDILFAIADFLARPPGFYVMLAGMLACTVIVPLGVSYNMVTFGLSVLAIIITGVVLIQGYRDTAAIHAKLDEVVLRLPEPNAEVVGLEKRDPDEIKAKLEELEGEAHAIEDPQASPLHGGSRPRSEVRKARRHRSKDGT